MWHQSIDHIRHPISLPFACYLTLNNDITTLKSSLEVTQGHWKWDHSIHAYEFLSAFHSIYVASFPR